MIKQISMESKRHKYKDIVSTKTLVMDFDMFSRVLLKIDYRWVRHGVVTKRQHPIN